MKIFSVSLLIAASAVGAVAAAAPEDEGTSHHLRNRAEVKEDSVCNQQPDQETCFQTSAEDGTACQWCVAGAIPSECMSAEQAKILPEGVFECSAPSSSSSMQQHQQQQFEFPSQHFAATSSQTYTLKVNAPQPTKSDLCDDSSASLSGYMDIKGSEYDSNDENKHLFFWMFEKRGEIADDTPFVVWVSSFCCRVVDLLGPLDRS